MKEILKLNLVGSGIPSFVLKNNRILVEEKVVKDKEGNVVKDEEGIDVKKKVYKYELDEKFCKERYDQMVNMLPQFNGILVIYGVNENGKKEMIDFINCKGELRSDFKKGVKDGMGRYEWMKSKLTEIRHELIDNKVMEVKYKRIDFNLGVKV